MLRTAAASVAKRAVLRYSHNGVPLCALPTHMNFHSSVKREEEAKAVTIPESKGGLFGTGLSEWFALPIGIAAAVPLIKLEWYVINEETQLMAVFVAFVVTCYTQAGDAFYKTLDEKAVTLLKDHTEAEEKVIKALEQKLVFLKANHNMVNDFEAINAIRAATYEKLNKAGAVKPHHDFKAQVERILNMIVVEETNVTEKMKVALMKEATVSVTERFATDKTLKKAALDAAIAKIKGGKADDPVQKAFIQFFKDKASAVAARKDDSEEKAQRESLIAKMNSIAKNEGFFFQFDAQGQPKMVV